MKNTTTTYTTDEERMTDQPNGITRLVADLAAVCHDLRGYPSELDLSRAARKLRALAQVADTLADIYNDDQ